MLSEQICLQIADPVEVFTDFSFRQRRSDSSLFQPTNRLADLKAMLLGKPCRMDKPCFEVGHDYRVEPRDPMIFFRADYPIDGKAHLFSAPVHQSPKDILGDLQGRERFHDRQPLRAGRPMPLDLLRVHAEPGDPVVTSEAKDALEEAAEDNVQ